MKASNSAFAIGGVSCSVDSLVDKESEVLRINIRAKKHAYQKSANHYLIFYERTRTGNSQL